MKNLKRSHPFPSPGRGTVNPKSLRDNREGSPNLRLTLKLNLSNGPQSSLLGKSFLSLAGISARASSYCSPSRKIKREMLVLSSN